MRRNIGRHAHGDAAGTIGEKVGEETRKNLRLLLFPVVGRDKIDGTFVEALHQAQRRLRQARFCITIGSGVIAVDIPEVPLPVDKRITQREILRQAHHGIINRLVAMRMVLTDNVADHAGRFLVRIGRVQLELAHRPQQAAVDRLQPVPKIRQRARGNRAQRIDEIPFRKRGIERGINDGVERIGAGIIEIDSSHVVRPTTATARLSARNGALSPHVVWITANQGVIL